MCLVPTTPFYFIKFSTCRNSKQKVSRVWKHVICVLGLKDIWSSISKHVNMAAMIGINWQDWSPAWNLWHRTWHCQHWHATTVSTTALWWSSLTKIHGYISSPRIWKKCRFAVKNSKKKSWPVTGLQNRGHSKLIVYESKWFPCSFRINLMPFRIFRGPLFHKLLTGQEPFFAVSYSKPALVLLSFLQRSLI